MRHTRLFEEHQHRAETARKRMHDRLSRHRPEVDKNGLWMVTDEGSIYEAVVMAIGTMAACERIRDRFEDILYAAVDERIKRSHAFDNFRLVKADMIEIKNEIYQSDSYDDLNEAMVDVYSTGYAMFQDYGYPERLAEEINETYEEEDEDEDE